MTTAAILKISNPKCTTYTSQGSFLWSFITIGPMVSENRCGQLHVLKKERIKSNNNNKKKKKRSINNKSPSFVWETLLCRFEEKPLFALTPPCCVPSGEEVNTNI